MFMRWAHQQVKKEETCTMSSLHYQLFLFFCFYTAVQAPYREGDIMLGGLFNVHQLADQPGSQCGEINLGGLGRMQAMIFAIERINNDTSLLSNISLGYDIRDYCGNLSKAAGLVYKLFTVDSCVNLSQNATRKKAIISLIGPHESSTALFIGGFLRMLNVSSISGSATSAELSSLTYDHFFRTVPSDTFLAKAMVDLVTHFNWSYVAVVGLDDSYGRNGAWAVVSESRSRKNSFCIALTEFIRHESGGTISPSAGSKSCSECPIGTMSNQAKTECVALPSANISYTNITGIVILTFGTLGVVVTLFCLAALCKFWNSPIVKASNRELSLSLLITILASFSLVYIDVFKTTNTICMIMYPLRYLTYNICLSTLLVKVLLISCAFRVPIMTSLELTSLPNKAQVGIVIAFLAPLLSVLMPWLLLDPPFNSQHIYPKRYTFDECKAYSGSVGKSLFLATCFYIFFLMLLSSFCAFKIRKVPENFSEAKRIAFSMYIFLFSLLCYHPVELSLNGWYVTVVDCVTTLLSAYGFLCCLFLPKMYILFFRQEMNDANGVKQEVAQFSFSSGCVRVNRAFDSSN